MKILVTGGCGYIGSHVARAFKLDNILNKVFVLDKVQRDHTLIDIDGWHIDDFASSASLAMMSNLEFDVIVHCAGTSLVGPSIENPAEYWDNNVTKTIRMLDMLRLLPNPPVIMFSSSASVYGTPDVLPITELHKLNPISPYGNTKATVERILHDYAVAYNMSSVCFRYFNAAGATPLTTDLGQEPGATHIIARALEASINKTEFCLYGDDYLTKDGTCVRDYVHVWDIAQAHVIAVRLLNQRKYFCQLYNLGTGSGISNKEILSYIKQQYGLLPVSVAPARPGDPGELIADPTRANVVLEWYPRYSDLKTIVDSAYKWYTRV